MNNNLQFLDLLAIISFALQTQNLQLNKKQATNNEVLRNLHADLEVVDAKLDQILAAINIEKPLP